MLKLDLRHCLRACTLTASLVFVPFVFADVIEFSPVVPPADGSYTLMDTCISVVCLENISVSNFTGTTSEIVGGNELTESNVSLTANIFQNVGGSPGVFISPLTLNGQVDITYLSKTSLSELGTFTTDVTSFNLTGSFNGLNGEHTVSTMLNPAEPSTGQTTVSFLGGSPHQYDVSSDVDLFAELSIDDGPFVPGPERHLHLTSTPEPAYFGSIGLLLAGIVALRSAKSKGVTRA